MNSKYPVTVNHIAFVVYNDEPVFVIKITKNDDGQDIVVARRSVNTTEGIKYEQETFLLAELDSEQAHVISHMEMTKFQAEQRDRYSKEYQAAQKASALPSVPDSTGYAN